MSIEDLNDISEDDWEDICTNCGQCCLVKLQDEDTNDIFYTNVVCKYFLEDTCKCSVYTTRCTLVPECIKLDKGNVDKISWMPKNCAYRCILEDRDIIEGGNIKGKCVSELDVKEEDLEDHIIDWEDL